VEGKVSVVRTSCVWKRTLVLGQIYLSIFGDKESGQHFDDVSKGNRIVLPVLVFDFAIHPGLGDCTAV